MNHSLNHFSKQMIDFEIYRNSQLVSTIKGLKMSYQGKEFIEFSPNADVQPGDVLINSNIKYFVDNIDVQTFKGQNHSLNAYYHL